MHRKAPTFIDLFAGCGGLSLGLHQAGWRGLFAIEKDQDAFATLNHNLVSGTRRAFDWPSWLDVEAMSVQKLHKEHATKLRSLRGKVDVLAGGPPCQGYSTFGRRDASDPRNQLFRSYIHIVEAVRPKVVLIENVRGIQFRFKSHGSTKGKKSEGVIYAEKITAALDGAGYHPLKIQVSADDFCVPQVRSRVIILGFCKKLWKSKELPDIEGRLEKVRQQFAEHLGLRKARISVEEAISDLQRNAKTIGPCPEMPRFEQGRHARPRTAYQRLMHGRLNGALADSHRFARHGKETVAAFSYYLAACPKGKKLEPSERGRFANRKHTVYVLDPKKPAPTVTTLPDDMVHFSEPRILTVREMARLQSFPDWFAFKGKYTTGGLRRKQECPRYTQVGNAVPPLLSEALARALQGLLSGGVAALPEHR
jgi:DNA (cytosine-5)-methyltransferase 1